MTHTISDAPALSTGKTLTGIVIGVIMSFTFYVFYLSVFFTLDITYNLFSLSSGTIPEGTEILLKFFLAFTALSTTMCFILPLIFRLADKENKNSISTNLKTNVLLLLLFFSCLIIEYFLFTEYMSGYRHNWIISLMILIAIVMFFIPWIQFIKNHKVAAYRWVVVAFSLSMICAALFPAIT